MSLSTPVPSPQYSYGLLVSKAFDQPELLTELFPSLDSIGHLHTNGENAAVIQFARDHGFPLTLWPVTGGRVTPWAISRVVESSDAVYIIANESSKSAALSSEKCVSRAKSDPKFRWKLIPFEPISIWRNRVFKAKEILVCTTPDDEKRNGWMVSVGKALDS